MIVGGLAVIIFALPTASGIKARLCQLVHLGRGLLPRTVSWSRPKRRHLDRPVDGACRGDVQLRRHRAHRHHRRRNRGPRRTLIPRATNGIYLAILVFYIGALRVIMAVIPWNTIGGDDVPSPFVQIFDSVGIHAAAGILNFVCLTAVMSVYNSGLYANSRMLYSLAKQGGNAPAYLGKLSSRGVPVAGDADVRRDHRHRRGRGVRVT